MTVNLLSLARDLQRRKSRKRRGLTVIEGVRLIEEAFAAELAVRGVLASPDTGGDERSRALLAAVAARAIPLADVTSREFATIADTQTPQGIAAIVEMPRHDLAAIVPRPRAPVLVLDAVQDPGNVGALIRTAWALGSPGAILLDGTADVANPKVIRAGMGATFRLPVASAVVNDLKGWLRKHDVTLWATSPAGSAVGTVPVPERLAVAVGNEGAGAREEIVAMATARIAIPLARGADSLNVVAATGIVLFEASRHA